MSATASLPVSLAPAPTPAASAARPARAWLVGPWFDLLCVANLTWPIIALLFLNTSWGSGSLKLIQMYFLTTPHRWITLVLVFADGDHFWKQPRKFGYLGLALLTLGMILTVVGNSLSEHFPVRGDALFLFIILDSAWNVWHFAAQHAGVSRIYGRFVRPTESLRTMNFEKTAIRLIVLWAYFRLALYLMVQDALVATDGFLGWVFSVVPWLDPLFVLPALILLGREIVAYQPQARGRLAYLGSLVTLYTALTIGLHFLVLQPEQATDQNSLIKPYVMALAFVSSVFHATEYLAIVSWSVRRKSAGVWQFLAPRWALSLVLFMIVMGVTSLAMISDQWWGNAWILANLLVSLLHYAYDGIIWRSKPAPKPAVA